MTSNTDAAKDSIAQYLAANDERYFPTMAHVREAEAIIDALTDSGFKISRYQPEDRPEPEADQNEGTSATSRLYIGGPTAREAFVSEVAEADAKTVVVLGYGGYPEGERGAEVEGDARSMTEILLAVQRAALTGKPLSMTLALDDLHAIREAWEQEDEGAGEVFYRSLLILLNDGPKVGLHIVAWKPES